jgi:hypothetical protein
MEARVLLADAPARFRRVNAVHVHDLHDPLLKLSHKVCAPLGEHAVVERAEAIAIRNPLPASSGEKPFAICSLSNVS